jgi:quercetin dioxygenase-like cupin family protein
LYPLPKPCEIKVFGKEFEGKPFFKKVCLKILTLYNTDQVNYIKRKEMIMEPLTGEVSKLADLVNYQTGAIVSRSILNQKNGTITLFAFDQGQKLSEHSAPFDALVYVLDGEVQLTVSGKNLLLRAGEMTLMLAGQPHALQADKRFKMLLTMIRS